MNSVTVPPSPNWYESGIMSCASDGTLVYGSSSSLVFVKSKSGGEAAEVRQINPAHGDRVNSVSLSPIWGDRQRLAVSAADDRHVKLWDCDTLELVSSHSVHAQSNSARAVRACFAGPDKIVSVSMDGAIVLWKHAINELTQLKNLLGKDVRVMCLSSCPHAPWLTAFGLKNGNVMLIDLRKQGSVKYRLKGHTGGVDSLSWCPVPYNIYPKPKAVKLQVTNWQANKQSAIPAESKSEADSKSETELKSETESKLETESEPTNGLCAEPTTSKPEGELVTEANGTETQVEEVNDDSKDELSKEKVTDESTVDENKEVASELSNEEDKTEGRSPEKPMEKVNNESTVEDNKEVASELSNEQDKTEQSPEKHKENDEVADSSKKNDTLEGGHSESDKSIDATTNGSAHDHSLSEPVVDDQNGETIKVLCKDPLVEENIEEPEKREREFLLASAAKDNYIMIWRAGTTGTLQRSHLLQGKSSRGNRYRKDKYSKEDTFVALNWIAPTTLLSSGGKAELLQWELLGDKSSKEAVHKIVHSNHSFKLFAIAAPHDHYAVPNGTVEATDSEKPKLFTAWSFGKDRYLINTVIDATREIRNTYCTQGSPVSVIAASPVDPNIIAIGCQDGSICTWNLSREHVNSVVMHKLGSKWPVKVTTLAWHPEQDVCLAYGNDEGQVVVLDTSSNNKGPVIMPRYFRKTVHKLEWGPSAQNKDAFSLYGCAEGKVIVFNVDEPKEAPAVIQIPDEGYVSHFSWKPDYSLLALGSKDGSILVFSDKLELITTVYYQQKSITSMAWHPHATAEDEEASKYHTWLATSTSSDGSIVVYDLKDVTCETKDFSEKIVAERKVHHQFVHSMNWNTLVGGRLVSAANDGSVQVWDVANDKIVSTFMNTTMLPVMACIWSTVNKNFVISGGRETAVRVWNVEEHPPKTIEEIAEEVQKKKNLIRAFGPKEQNISEKDFTNKKVSPRDVLLSLVANRQGNPTIVLEDCKKLMPSESNDTETNSVLQLFGNADGLNKLIDEQKQVLKRKPNSNLHHLSLMKGDIGDEIRDAIDRKTVTPFLLSIATMVSPTLWQEATEAYANQLSEIPEGNCLETASYYLACHKVDKAIEALCRGTLYREALLLAKCRLPNAVEVVNDVLEKWAGYLSDHGQFEVGCQCYIVLGKYEEAAKMLNKRSNTEALSLALELAQLSKNEELCNTIKYRIEKLQSPEKGGGDDIAEKPLPSRVELVLNGAADKVDE